MHHPGAYDIMCRTNVVNCLHSYGAVCHLPRFETVTRGFPTVELVITSTWRERFALEELRARFSLDIAARTIDATPILHCPFILARRQKEILKWLTTLERGDEPWLALDDASWHFSEAPPSTHCLSIVCGF
ncbi:MAG: HAD domain-containing protein [Hylemonella sp.]